MSQNQEHEIVVIDPSEIGARVDSRYYNKSLTPVNDHEIRLSVMTEQFAWHSHPTSDETFLGVDGDLVVELEDREIIVRPGQFVTIPAGTVHRTRPAGERSVNLTIERANAETRFLPD